MSFLCRTVITLLLALSVASPGLARMATIETTAPLQDHSEQSIKTAFKHAVMVAMRGASAMGLGWVQVRQALVLEDMVAVLILATDTDPAEEKDEEPGAEPGARADEPERFDL